MIPLNDLGRRLSISPEIEEAILRVYRSGHWIHGPEHKSFEDELGAYLNTNFVLGVASGTDALEIALRSVGCVNGSKVISVANAGGYTSIAATSIGCEVIYCDIDPEKHLLDPENLLPLLSEDVAAVVVTHLYGNVAPVKKIMEMCEPFGINVIEDCAQAIGANQNSISVGTIGHVGTFSFYPTKNLGGIGDGGALATNDPEIAQRITELRQYGWTSKYKIDVPGGMNSRLDEIQAAVLRVGLSKLDFMNRKRRQIVEQYSIALKDSALRLVTSFENENVAHLAVLEVPEPSVRDTFRRYMTELGIQTDIHYPSLDCDQKGLKSSKVDSQLSRSRRASELIVTIPLFPELSESEITEIVAALADFNSAI
jgi:aminotransferase EvaB